MIHRVGCLAVHPLQSQTCLKVALMIVMTVALNMGNVKTSCLKSVNALESTALGNDQAKILAKTTALGLCILNCHANFEESGADVDIRTSEFGTHLCSAIGNGKAIDLHLC